MRKNNQVFTTSRTIVMPNNELWSWEDFTPEEQNALFLRWSIRYLSTFGLTPKKNSEHIINDAENILNKIDYKTKRNTKSIKQINL